MPFQYKPLTEIFPPRLVDISPGHDLLIVGQELDPIVSQGTPVRLLLVGSSEASLRMFWAKYLPPGSRITVSSEDEAPNTPRAGDGVPNDIVIIDAGADRYDAVIARIKQHAAQLMPNGICIATHVRAADMARGAELLFRPASTVLGETRIESVSLHCSTIVIKAAASRRKAGHASNPRIAQLEAKLLDAEAADHRHAGELSRLQVEAVKASPNVEIAREHAAALTAAADRATLLQGDIERLVQRSALLEHEIAHLRGLIDLVQGSIIWRLSATLRAMIGTMPDPTKIWLRRGFKAGWWAATPWRMRRRIQHLRDRRQRLPAIAAAEARGSVGNLESIYSLKRPESPYSRWVAAYDTLTDSDRRAIKARIVRLRYKPVISIVMPVYNTDLTFLREAIQSIRLQLYPYWELCIADDASTDPGIKAVLNEAADADPRVKVLFRDVNGHISAASNSALAVATGEFVGLMDHDDLIPEHALFLVAASLNDDSRWDLIYSDEDHLDEHGKRTSPYFKSDFNYELLLGHNMVNHFAVFRREVLNRAGGFRIGYEGSQDYDLVLRFIDLIDPRRILHIPSVLYHWRSSAIASKFSPDFAERCIHSARQAIADHLGRRGVEADVLAHPVVASWHRVRRARPAPAPLVSIIVPTKDKAKILRPCCEGILQRTRYTNIELIIVDHQSTEPQTLQLFEELSRDDRVRIMPYEGEFNYSAINNAAVATARGTVLALVNNDIEVIDDEWLDEMVALAVQDEIGAVGAKLLYANNRVQHGGVLIGTGGVAGHLSHMLEPNDPGDMGRAVLTTAVSAVTGACLVIRTATFNAVGGFDDKNLPIAFNDVDLCLKVREAGYRNVLAAHAILYHHESVSRGLDVSPEKAARFRKESIFMIEKWGDQLMADPFYNPNLDLATAKHEPAFPPRTKRAWTPQD